MIDVNVQKFFIVFGPIVQLELLVDGILENGGRKKIEHEGKDPIDALLGALSEVFGYNATEQTSTLKVPGQKTVVIEHNGNKYKGSAQFKSDTEILDSIVYAYFKALEQIVGKEIKVQLPVSSTPYNWEA